MAMPWLMDRQGANPLPQVEESNPLFATRIVAAPLVEPVAEAAIESKERQPVAAIAEIFMCIPPVVVVRASNFPQTE